MGFDCWSRVGIVHQGGWDPPVDEWTGSGVTRPGKVLGLCRSVTDVQDRGILS